MTEYLTPVYEQNHTYEGVVYDAPDNEPKKDLSLVTKSLNGSKSNLNGLPLVTKTLTNNSRTNLITTKSDDVTKSVSKKRSRKGARCCVIAGIISVLLCLILTTVNVILLLYIKDNFMQQTNRHTIISSTNSYNNTYSKNAIWEWGLWGACTADCGVGMKSRERYCGNQPCGDGILDKDICYLGKCEDNIPPIGFSAKVMRTLNNVQEGSTIVYDGVDYNQGDGYNEKTGIFTCPQDGAYLFIMFVQGLHSKAEGAAQQTSLVLKVNGNPVRSLVSEPIRTGQDETGGNSVIHHMEKGNMAWIETYYDSNQTIYSGRSSFTGVLLR